MSASPFATHCQLAAARLKRWRMFERYAVAAGAAIEPFPSGAELVLEYREAELRTGAQWLTREARDAADMFIVIMLEDSRNPDDPLERGLALGYSA